MLGIKKLINKHEPIKIFSDFFVLLFLFLFLLMSGACVKTSNKNLEALSQEVSPVPYTEETNRFYDANGNELSFDKLLSELVKADYLLIGERHTSLEQHKVQGLIIKALSEKIKALPVENSDFSKLYLARMGIGLEMLPFNENQRLYKIYRKGLNGKALSLEAFSEKINWLENWGFPIEYYASPLNFALTNNIPLFGLNANKKLLQAVRESEPKAINQLSDKERQKLGLTKGMFVPNIIPVGEAQKGKLKEIFNAHPMTLAMALTMASAQNKKENTENKATLIESEEKFLRFLKIQAFWDTFMAHQAIDAKQKLEKTLVILVGAGHVEYGLGIAKRIHELQPEAKVLSILPLQKVIHQPNGGFSPYFPEKMQVNVVRENGQELKENVSAADFFVLTKADPLPVMPQGRLGIKFELQTNNAKTNKIFVKEVLPNSRAEKAGVKSGDILLKINKKTVNNLEDIHKFGRAAFQNKEALSLELKRNQKTIKIVIPNS
ncbi:ChaN family lipoprotein [Desulfovibrio litoralis]|uniref:Uncharacterized iron-regulated protein n=1 Tax=Desulfovibrio litoralis DSM 11393 TaxID=1121455 RepID=A0A1M7T2J8_9BACT|nr:ChaN family lipoprotein [Desulfovibrio litoralis]SHN64919.1 Uncharacterized iron-regulated protein [Desulfovibrio litoralis DSM 11393]